MILVEWVKKVKKRLFLWLAQVDTALRLQEMGPNLSVAGINCL